MSSCNVRFYFRIIALLSSLGLLLIFLGCNEDHAEPDPTIAESKHDDFILSTQEKVNEFGVKNVGTTGFLYIGPRSGIIKEYYDEDYDDRFYWVIDTDLALDGESTDITDLTPLINLKSVPQELAIINNDNLKSLDGLQNIESCYSLEIHGNDSLSSLESLEKMTLWADRSYGKSYGNLSIESNNSLESIKALENIPAVNNLTISGNPKLTSLKGLHNINVINRNLRIDGEFATLGFGNLGRIGGGLYIIGTQILDLSDFNKISSLEGLTIKDNTILKSLEGLENIITYGPIEIASNDMLQNLDGLSPFSVVKGLKITGNNSLTSLENLENLTAIDNILRVSNNKSLTTLNGLQNVKVVRYEPWHTWLTFPEFVDIEGNDKLIDFCAIQDLITVLDSLDSNRGGWQPVYYCYVSNNGFNPTAQEIVDGNCKQ